MFRRSIREQNTWTASTAATIAALLGISTLPSTLAVEPPSYEVPNSNYRVRFNGVATPVVQHECSGRHCRLRGPNNIASVTMHQTEEEATDGLYSPIIVVVEKLTYNASRDGHGWHIRPSHLQEEGIVATVNSSLLFKAGSISFVVTAPCQLSVELGSEEILFKTKSSYWGFSNLIIAVNPPESSWRQAKPTLVEDPVDGTLTCTSSLGAFGRSCIVARADNDCGVLEVPRLTDIYFTSRLSKSYRWGDGCGLNPKRIALSENATLFLDEEVVIFSRVVATSSGAAVFGYGIISNFYMNGTQEPKLASNVVELQQSAVVYGVTLMDSTYRNIKVGKSSEVAWTKSFAWEGETDGVSLAEVGCIVHNNFFKVNDDVLKPYLPHTVYRDNVIWHQTVGRAVMLSWGNPEENRVDRDGTTQLLRTSVIHDYRSHQHEVLNRSLPDVLSRQTDLVLWGSLISVQHSMNNFIGKSDSPILIKDFFVEGPVGVLISMSTGYKQLGGNARWQASNGCGGNLNFHIRNLDLRRVYSYAGDSFAGGCDLDYSYPSLENAVCLCTTELGCGESRCHVDLRFADVLESRVKGVPSLADTLHVGANTVVEGLSTESVVVV